MNVQALQGILAKRICVLFQQIDPLAGFEEASFLNVIVQVESRDLKRLELADEEGVDAALDLGAGVVLDGHGAPGAAGWQRFAVVR